MPLNQCSQCPSDCIVCTCTVSSNIPAKVLLLPDDDDIVQFLLHRCVDSEHQRLCTRSCRQQSSQLYRLCIPIVVLLLHASYTSGFVLGGRNAIQRSLSFSRSKSRDDTSVVPLTIVDDDDHMALMMAATETTTLEAFDNVRQYIPLGVSVLVIIDILLGSPLANGVLNKIRPTTTTTSSGNDNEAVDHDGNISRSSQKQPSRERIDSQKVAQDAIQRAKYTMELRTFLDERRDPVVELRRKMDQQTALLEQSQKQLQEEMDRSSN